MPEPTDVAAFMNARHENYEMLGANMKVLQDNFRSETPDMAAATAAATNVKAFADAMGAWFPAGTGPDSGIESEAKAEIWTDRATFDAAVVRLQEESAKLAAATDAAAFKAHSRRPVDRARTATTTSGCLTTTSRQRGSASRVRTAECARTFKTEGVGRSHAAGPLGACDLHRPLVVVGREQADGRPLLVGPRCARTRRIPYLLGFAGPETARFARFLKGPRAVFAYLGRLFRSDYRASFGHNPLGALSVIALLLAVAIQAGLGLFASDTSYVSSGPLSHLVDYETSEDITDLHGDFFDVLLIVIGLHLAAIVFYFVVKRTNLVGPMLTGSRKAENVEGPPAGIAPVSWLRLVIGIVLAVGVIWFIAR
jgi:cytochrome b/cytochrome c556